jgi:hypothetical protein
MVNAQDGDTEGKVRSYTDVNKKKPIQRLSCLFPTVLPALPVQLTIHLPST